MTLDVALPVILVAGARRGPREPAILCKIATRSEVSLSQVKSTPRSTEIGPQPLPLSSVVRSLTRCR